MSTVSTAVWASTVAIFAVLIAIDLLLLGRRSGRVGTREAALWSTFYITVALAFGAAFGVLAGWESGTQYFAAYIVEKSLSIDNVFVFVVILGSFSVPEEWQPKVLTIGIVAALALRLVLILIGASLIDAFSFMFLVFGAALLITAIQLFRHRDRDPAINENVVVSLARRLLPISDRYHGSRLVVRAGGRNVLTPLFLVVVAIGSTDVLFAFDSIPAAFGVTRHAYVVFAANAFALLGLRAIFFLVAGLLDRLVYLSTGLALVLAFIGVKLMLHFAHTRSDAVPEISTAASLGVIGAILLAVTLASLVQARRHAGLRAHAGTLRAREQRRRDAAEAEGDAQERRARPRKRLRP